jgi:uncharacterized phiE125 gp8 family phage protein
MHKNTQLLKANKTEFITLKKAKQYLRIDHELDDETITDMLEIVLVVAENYLRLKLQEACWKITIYDNLPYLIKLQNGPIVGIESFKIYKPGGEITHLLDHHFMFDQFAELIRIRQHYAIEKAEIIYHSGYSKLWLPAPIKQGMLEHLAKLYDLRGSDQGLPLSVKSLYQLKWLH